MMPTAAKDRVRASRLRKAKGKGKTISPDDAAWLDAYERSSTRATIRAAKKNAPHAPHVASSSSEPRTVRGPQLALNGVSRRSGGHVHKTTPVDGRIDPAAHLWTPKVPPRPADADPPIPGMPPPPVEGTPLVDGANASAQGTGDPAAAAQFAAFVLFFVQLGVGAGRELAAEMELPPEVRAMLGSDELAVGALQTVHDAAARLAMKYGFKQVPMGDELIVAAALVGSGALVAKNMKRKKLATSSEKKPRTDEEKKREREAPAAPAPVSDLWGRS